MIEQKILKDYKFQGGGWLCFKWGAGDADKSLIHALISPVCVWIFDLQGALDEGNSGRRGGAIDDLE